VKHRASIQSCMLARLVHSLSPLDGVPATLASRGVPRGEGGVRGSCRHVIHIMETLVWLAWRIAASRRKGQQIEQRRISERRCERRLRSRPLCCGSCVGRALLCSRRAGADSVCAFRHGARLASPEDARGRNAEANCAGPHRSGVACCNLSTCLRNCLERRRRCPLGPGQSGALSVSTRG